MIAAFEDGLRGILAALLPELEVTAYPEGEKAYRLTHPKGAALLVYSGSHFGGCQALGPVQPWNLEFLICLKLRDLRGNAGAYELIERIRAGLSGQDVLGARFYPTAERLEGRQDGVWSYRLSYSAKLSQVAGLVHPDEAELAPSFKRLEYQGGMEDLSINMDTNQQPKE